MKTSFNLSHYFILQTEGYLATGFLKLWKMMVVFSLLTSHLPFLLWTSALNIQNAAPGNDYRCDPWCVRAQLCLTLWDPMDYNLPGSSVHGISQARMLEWVAVSFSRGSSQPRDGTHVSGGSCIGKWILDHLCHLGRPKPCEIYWIEVNVTYPSPLSICLFLLNRLFHPSLPGHLPCQCPCPSSFWHTQTHPASLSESIHLNFGYSSPTSKQSPHSLILPSFKMENSRRDLDFQVVYSKGPCFKKRTRGISPSVQWLGLQASTAGQATSIPHAVWPKNVLSFKAEFKALPLEKQPGYPLEWELIQ